jgi:hypothetical protein
MLVRPPEHVLEGMRRKAIEDARGQVRAMLDQVFAAQPTADPREMAVLLFDVADPAVNQIIQQYLLPLPPPRPEPGPPSIAATVVRRSFLQVLAAATTPEGQPVTDCAPIMALEYVPVACFAFGGMTVAATFPRASAGSG